MALFKKGEKEEKRPYVLYRPITNKFKIKGGDDEGTYEAFEDLPEWAQGAAIRMRDPTVLTYKGGYASLLAAGIFISVCTALSIYTGEYHQFPELAAFSASGIPLSFLGAYKSARCVKKLETIPKSEKKKVKKAKTKKARVPKKVKKPAPEPMPETKETGYLALSPGEEVEEWRVEKIRVKPHEGPIEVVTVDGRGSGSRYHYSSR